jgi:hypothetical protein
MGASVLEEGDGSQGQRSAEGKGSDLHLEELRSNSSVLAVGRLSAGLLVDGGASKEWKGWDAKKETGKQAKRTE